MIAEKVPYIKSAYDQLQIISQDKQKRMEYDTVRITQITDLANQINKLRTTKNEIHQK